MQKLLTLTCSPEKGNTSLGKGLFCALQEYTDAKVQEFSKEATCWELKLERNIQFVEWHDNSTYILDATPDMFVIDNGSLTGLFYDSCYFVFSNPDTHKICNSRPDYRNIGHNFIGCVYYSLRHRPDDKVVYSEDGHTLISFPKNHCGSFSVPEHVTRIGLGAFRKCALLTEVVIPSSVTTMEQEAFYGCTALEKVVIADSLTSIGNDCFKNCTAPKTISIPAGMHYCHFIGMNAKAYVVSPAHPKYASVDGVIFSKDMSVLERYPAANPSGEYTIPETVTRIRSNAFSLCKNLKEIHLPDSLKSIEAMAFFGLNLENLVLPEGLEFLAKNAIDSCGQLESLTIPSTVQKVEWNYFPCCTSLETIYIHKSQRGFDVRNWREKTPGNLEDYFGYLDNIEIIYYE